MTAPQRSEPILPVAAVAKALRVGEVVAEHTYRVDPNDVARFRSAIAGENMTSCEPVPAEGDPAPPTFFAALDPVERRDLQIEEILDSIPYPRSGGGNAFNEVSYDRPLRAGEVIRVATTYQDVYERTGRSGTLLFRVRVNELFDAADERVATTWMGHVLAFDTRQRS